MPLPGRRATGPIRSRWRLRLRDALERIADAPDTGLAEAAREMSTRALDYADAALPLESERTRLREASGGISFLP